MLGRHVARGEPGRTDGHQADEGEEQRPDTRCGHRVPPSGNASWSSRIAIRGSIQTWTTSAENATRPTMRATVAGAAGGEIQVARVQGLERQQAESAPRGDEFHGQRPAQQLPGDGAGQAEDGWQRKRPGMSPRDDTPRHSARSCGIETALVLHTVERACLQALDQRRGRERQRDHHHGEGRQPAARGDHGEQQRDDERRDREQQDGHRGDAVAHEP